MLRFTQEEFDARVKKLAAIPAKVAVASESKEQSAVIEWWASYCRTVGLDERLLFAVPNAQKFMSKARNIHAAYAHAKAEGLREGVPDLFLALPSDVFAGAFFEMKSKTGGVSEAQRGYHDLLRRTGYSVITAFGADEAITAIKAYSKMVLRYRAEAAAKLRADVAEMAK